MNRLLGIVMMSLCVVGWVAPAIAQSNNSFAQLQAEINALQTQVNSLQTTVNAQQTTINSLQTALATVQANNALLLGPYVTVDTNAENGLKGPNVVFKGANVHIESGSGSTVDNTGLGNLIVGYDGESTDVVIGCSPSDEIEANRIGSHNFIVGDCHQFTSSGGLVAGLNNIVDGPFASVSGGVSNLANGNTSSISGGGGNTASGVGSSVCGGGSNTASGNYSSVSGGGGNTARGNYSSVSGGGSNTASGVSSSVGGEAGQNATGQNQNIN